MERQAHELNYVRRQEPLPTVEVDVDSLDPEGPTVADIVGEALSKHATGKPNICATAYMYFTPSVNFGEPTSSEFVMVAGPKALYDVVLAAFRAIGKVRCRPSDMLKPEMHMAIAHVEEGLVWEPLDTITWGTTA
ncbi:hypothetical protein RM533_07545 [Croceicoccus sp. F390]|uniref:Uncharacterized protein n=1 Tax=Croceicoccus esteveae TaxID=3075597 RepID=A0ABU2ZHG2_9SPHN|nr:hypothetical protein [Croceicoccus sp. F390]MDT0576039.1 hypothetical protein [Croceicoccus sp. F390]